MTDPHAAILQREVERLQQQVANLHEDRTLMTTGIARYVDTIATLREALERLSLTRDHDCPACGEVFGEHTNDCFLKKALAATGQYDG